MYNEAERNLRQVASNINSIRTNLDNFDRICSDILMINDNSNYKNSTVNIKYSVYNQRVKILNEVIPEIKSKQ